MACLYPVAAWRTRDGEVYLAKERPDSQELQLPCGSCVECTLANARAWALRCDLELQRHKNAAFATLTYDDKSLPPTLEKRHLQLFLKRLRKRMGPARPIRFFACGEYGEQTARPHYHAILYGCSADDRATVTAAWSKGFVTLEPVTPERIAYCAGYTQKKATDRLKHRETERVDPETGEVYRWQPPFRHMSLKPGIGGHAREFTQSWRLYAVHHGNKMPVPRFLHEAWKRYATPQQVEDLLYEKHKRRMENPKEVESSTRRYERTKAREKRTETRQQLKAARRTL